MRLALGALHFLHVIGTLSYGAQHQAASPSGAGASLPLPLLWGLRSSAGCHLACPSPCTRGLAGPGGRMRLAAGQASLPAPSGSESSGWRVRAPGSFTSRSSRQSFPQKGLHNPQRSLNAPRGPKLGHPAARLPSPRRSLSASHVASIQPENSPEHVPTPVPRQQLP